MKRWRLKIAFMMQKNNHLKSNDHNATLIRFLYDKFQQNIYLGFMSSSKWFLWTVHQTSTFDGCFFRRLNQFKLQHTSDTCSIRVQWQTQDFCSQMYIKNFIDYYAQTNFSPSIFKTCQLFCFNRLFIFRSHDFCCQTESFQSLQLIWSADVLNSFELR